MPTIPGSEYAKRPLDWPTQAGIREALVESLAVFETDNLSDYFDKNPDGSIDDVSRAGVEKLRDVMHASIDKHEFLQGANTTDLVKGYVDNVLSSHSPTEIYQFANQIIEENDLSTIPQAIEENNRAAMASAASSFSGAFRQHLGRETLTGDFRAFLDDHGAALDVVNIEPKGFTNEQITQLDEMESSFRFIDGADNLLHDALEAVGKQDGLVNNILLSPITRHAMEATHDALVDNFSVGVDGVSHMISDEREYKQMRIPSTEQSTTQTLDDALAQAGLTENALYTGEEQTKPLGGNVTPEQVRITR